MLAQAEMESGDWQAADKVRFQVGRKGALVAFVLLCSHPLVYYEVLHIDGSCSHIWLSRMDWRAIRSPRL